MARTTEWLIAYAVLLVGIVLAGMAMFGMGSTLLWSGFGFDPRTEPGRPWWIWPLFFAPPVLMVAAGLLVRRAGASVPVAVGGAGGTGVLVGIAYLITAYATGR